MASIFLLEILKCLQLGSTTQFLIFDVVGSYMSYRDKLVDEVYAPFLGVCRLWLPMWVYIFVCSVLLSSQVRAYIRNG